MKLLKKLTAIIILLSMLITLNSPIISYAADQGTDGETSSTGETGEQTEEIGTDYEILETEEWDISKKKDKSVIAKWTLEDRTITISGSGEMKWFYGFSKAWSKYTTIIKHVEIEYGVTSIGHGAFYECSSLKSINIPNSVTSIEGYAFYECSSLESINIPNSVTSIGNNVFYGCSNLTNIEVEENNQNYISIEGVLYNKDKTNLIVYPSEKKEKNYTILNSVTSIKENAFDGCGSLTNIEIPDGVTSIGECVFRECSNLKNIEIPNSVTSIEGYAFYECSSLERINIPNSVTSIGDYVFGKCSNLTSIDISEGVTNIGDHTFYECSSLARFNIPNSVTSISKYAFDGCSSLTNIEIPNSVTSIGEHAFCECSSLTSINIPNNVTSIGSYVFYGCSNLTNIQVEKNNQYYSSIDGVLYSKDKTKLIQYPVGKNNNTYTIPNEVTSISRYAFYVCNRLEYISIPRGVINIDNDAIYKCKAIINCYTNSIAHEYCENNRILYILLDDIESTIENKYEVKKEETWDVSKDENGSVIAKWTFVDRTITISGSGRMKDWSYDSNVDWNSNKYRDLVEKVKIGNGVTSIGSYAFYKCSNLDNIDIPKSVTSIDYRAFSGCNNLKSIVIPENVNYIWNIFEDCYNLESINVEPNNHSFKSVDGVMYNSEMTSLIKYPGGKRNTQFEINSNVKYLSEYSFDGCVYLTNIILHNNVIKINSETFKGCSSLENITIPNSVTSIGSGAFEGCSSITSIEIPESVTDIKSFAFKKCSSLENIIIPNSVTSIGQCVFEGCSNLKNIEIPSSVTSIESSAFEGCSSLKNIDILSSITSIGHSAFEGCSSLINIEIPSSVTSIGSSAFEGCSSLTNITIPNSVTSIGSYAFYGCSSLKNIIISDNVTSIGFQTFYECSNLNSIEMSEGITSIGREAFLGCSSLTNINIPSSVISIGERAFEGCSSLTNIEISNNVTGIEDRAFFECSSLEDIEIPSSVTSIGSSAFYNIKGPIICKKNSVAQKYSEEKKIGYIVDSIAPTGTLIPNGNETTVKSIKTKANVEDNYSVDEESLKYLWSQKEEVTSEEITEKLTNGAELTSPEKTEGKIYLYIYAKDKVGNETVIKSNAFNVDDLGPQLNFQFNPECLTNQNVTATITSHEKIQGVEGWNLSDDKLKLTKEFEENMAEEIIVKDLLGNETKANIEVKNIDKIPSEIEVGYSETNPTNQNVIVTITGNEKLQQIEGWTSSEDGLKLTKEYDQNKSEEITVKDLAGNGTKANINISNIDKEIPVVEVSYSNKELTKENVIVTITGNEKLQQIEGWTLSQDGLKLTKEYEENETKEIDVKDLAGNIAKTEIKITNIDKKAPVIEGVQDKRSYARKATPKAVDENLESVKLEKEGQEVEGYENGTEITELGTYKIIAVDKVGNKTEVEFYIKDIPSTEEVVEYTVTPEGLTNQDVKVSVTKKENEEYQDLIIQMSTDGKNYEATTEKSLIKNGTVYIRIAKEEEGYTIEGEVIEVKVTNIDKTAPGGQIVYGTTNPTNQNVKVTIIANEEIQELEGWTRGEDRKTLTKEYEQNVKEEITIKDTVGNESKANVEITNIDKRAPEGQLEYSTINPTNQNVTVRIIANEEIQEVKGWARGEDRKTLTKEYNTNKAEKVIIKDIVGNEKEIEVRVLNIDRTAPVARISYNTTNPTNQNVIVTITTYEKVQGITGWSLSTDSKTLIKEYSENKIEEVTVKDLAGNSTNVTIEIANIDKTSPVITGVENGKNYKESVTAITTDENPGTLLLEKDGVQVKEYTNGKELTEKGVYKLTAVDKAGNTTTVNFTIKYMKGDLNENNQIDMGDVLLILRHIAQENDNKIYEKHPNWRLNDSKQNISDVNGNKKTDIGDVLKLRRYIAAKNSKEIANKHPDWLNIE